MRLAQLNGAVSLSDQRDALLGYLFVRISFGNWAGRCLLHQLAKFRATYTWCLNSNAFCVSSCRDRCRTGKNIRQPWSAYPPFLSLQVSCPLAWRLNVPLITVPPLVSCFVRLRIYFVNRLPMSSKILRKT